MIQHRPHLSYVFALACAAALACLGSCVNRRGGRGDAAAGPSAGVLAAGELTVAGVEREFRYFVPGGRTEASLPVVIYLHGYGGSARHAVGEGRVAAPSAGWMDVAQREGFLVLYPQGLKAEGWRGKCGWNDCRENAKGNPTGDDVGFLRELIDWALENLGGDGQRVYVTGMSNGGHMTMRLAMEMPERLAAAAPVAALMPKQHGCSAPAMPVPIMFLHGTEDPLAPFEGGAMAGDRGEVRSARETALQWVRWNGLAGVEPHVFDVPDRDPTDGSTLLGRSWELVPGGAAVTAYEVLGGGHTEPSEEYSLGRLQRRIQGSQNHDVETAELVWAFFRGRVR